MKQFRVSRKYRRLFANWMPGWATESYIRNQIKKWESFSPEIKSEKSNLISSPLPEPPLQILKIEPGYDEFNVFVEVQDIKGRKYLFVVDDQDEV
ncbi:MAG: hypothetical protein D6732_25265, partial [Methanobacteriota archaeon]